MNPKKLITSSFLAVGMAASANAAIVQIGHYGLGETGTVTGGSPLVPLIDDVGTANNITASQSIDATASIGTTGVSAPGSTAYLQKNSGNSGWHSNSVPYSLTDNWAVQLWMRPDTNGGTVQFQTDNSTVGASIWFQNSDGGNDIAFAHGGGGVASPTNNDFNYTTGTWYRLGIVRSNAVNYFYINGAQVASDTVNSTLGAPMLGFAQGGSNGGTGAYDELNVWSFASTDSLDSIETTMNAVPEPSAALLGGLGMLCLLCRRR